VVKFRHAVYKIDSHADRQTDRLTHHNTLQPYTGEGDKVGLPTIQDSRELFRNWRIVSSVQGKVDFVQEFY